MTKRLTEKRKYILTVFSLLIVLGTYLSSYADITPVGQRTPQVRDAIVAAAGVNSAADVTKTHLAAITSLNLRGKGISALKTGDFSGLTALTSLNLYNNKLSSLPEGIFGGLTSLTTIRLSRNTVDPLPFTVSLKKVADGQFKAIAPAGALFDIVLPITVTNGSVTGGATTATIPHGGVESSTLTVTRTTGTTAHVTVNIGTLPSLPRNHYGYSLVKSDTLPLTIISGTNTAPVLTDPVSDDSLMDNITDVQEVVTPDSPVTNTAPAFLEGENTARIVLENTEAGVNIGKPVSATDAENDYLTYTLSGIDAEAFDLDSSGQLKTKIALDYETKRAYTITITVSDNELSDTISVIIVVIDVNDTVSSMGFVPVADRTPAVRDAIVEAVPNVIDAANVTEAQVAAITSLNLRNKGITKLKTGDFSGMTALSNLNLYRNNLHRLPPDIFDGLTALRSLRLGGNVLDPMPLIVFLQRVGMRQYRAVITTGAPFNIVLPINVTNGSISGGTTSVTIPRGSVNSATFTVLGTSPKVVIGAFPKLPAHHFGYTLAQSTACGRTQQVTDAIAKVVGVSDCSIITEVELATITSLDLSDSSITSLSAVDFNGMFSLKTLYLHNNALTSLPNGVFDDLVSLRALFLNNNKLTTLPSDVFDEIPNVQRISLSNNRLTSLPNGIFEGLTQLSQLHLSGNPTPNSKLSLTVTLQKVGTSQFKVVVPTGAPFTLTLPITITNGRVVDGETTIIIPKGNVESRPFTVTRIADTIAAVTTDIGTPLPSLPSTHTGYAFVKSPTLPLEVLPSVNVPPVFKEGTNTTRTIAENTAAGTNIGVAVTATDKNVNDTLTYTLSSTDAASFDVDSKTGQLKTKAPLDYETKNTYSLKLTVSDGLVTDTIVVTINVTDIDENRAPVFKDGNSTTRTIAENTTAGTNIGNAITATDPDNDTLTYRLGGRDASAFDIGPTTGQLKTKLPLDYETKSVYAVSVTASDGKLTTTITVTVNVTDINELPNQVRGAQGFSDNNAPVFTDGSSTTRSVAENTDSGTDIGSAVSATDADGHTLTYSLDGTDANTFSIDSTTGQLRTNAVLDYETKSIYTVSVTVSDGKLTATIAVTINVTDVDELPNQVTGVQGTSTNNPPVFIDGTSTSRSVSEDTVSGIDIGSAVSATDTDGDTLTYTLSGTDASAFRIDSTTGQLQTDDLLDYETQSTYFVIITVSDGTLTDSISVTINITDIPETSSSNGPIFTEGTSTTRSVAENAADGTDIGSPITATDPDNGDLTYTLSGTDSYAFYIVNTTGQLRLSTMLDYETKNVYTVTVSVSNNDGESDSIIVTINVTDITAPNYPLYGRTQQIQDAVVKARYVNSADEVTAAHLADITWFELEDAGITALKAGDFYGFTSLKTLNLSDNSISDISPLGNLTTLLSLSLIDNSISNIAALRNLTKLGHLNISNNSISSISALRNLTKLKDLSMAGNSISDISALSKLTALKELNLSDNSISDISALENLTKLTSLYLNHNSINSISSLENLTNLKIIYLDYNSISDISILRNLTKLDFLSLSNNSISNISALGSLTALTTLILHNNTIGNVSSLENLTALTTLYLSGNPISDYGPLRRLKTANPEVYIDIDINNNPPVFTEGTSTTRTIAENTASGTDIGNAVSATDTDTDDTLTYTLGGTDAESFDIVSTSGQLQTKAALDYETKSLYTVTVDVSDGNDGLGRITVTINVTDVAEAPAARSVLSETALFSNFPNPFNPETWIPYQLAEPAEVTLTIYDMRGVVVREIALGHQAAGVYTTRSRAIHWNGRNSIGEKVATGLYFYTLTTGDFTATRRMLIRK